MGKRKDCGERGREHDYKPMFVPQGDLYQCTRCKKIIDMTED